MFLLPQLTVVCEHGIDVVGAGAAAAEVVEVAVVAAADDAVAANVGHFAWPYFLGYTPH